MVEKRVKKTIELIKDFLKERYISLDRIIVFGSQVKGGFFREDSDIDIAIVSRDFEGRDIFRRADMLKGLKWKLVEELRLSFDIIPVSLKEWQQPSSLMVEYIKEGKVLTLK